MKLRLTAALVTAGLTSTAGLLAQDDAPAAAKPDAAKATEAATPDAATPPAAPAPPALDPAVIKTNSSYGFGYRSGMQFAQQTSRFGLQVEDIDREAFIKGYFEAMAGGDPSVKEDDINAALQALGNQLQEREKQEAAANLAAGQKFLEENGKREGVITTESGLQYEVMKKGEGPVYQAPAEGTPSKQFMVKYKGTLIDGTEFDASPEGETVPMTLQVIPGFKEAITTMPVGSKWKLFIKPELAYGEQRRGPDIKPNSTLIFELELDNIQDAPAPPQPNFSMPPQGGQPQPGAARPPQPPRPRPTAVSPPVRVPIPPKPAEGGDKPAEGKE